MAALPCDSGDVKSILPMPQTSCMTLASHLFLRTGEKICAFSTLLGRRSSQYLRLWMNDVCYKITKAQ